MIGQHATTTTEYTVFRLVTNGDGYTVECDGVDIGNVATVAAAHKLAKDHARKHDNRGAGLTEVFGRNRQFIANARFTWTRFRGE